MKKARSGNPQQQGTRKPTTTRMQNVPYMRKYAHGTPEQPVYVVVMKVASFLFATKTVQAIKQLSHFSETT